MDIRVLVVEDELYARAKIVHFLSLTQQVSEVREAVNGFEGLRILQEWSPDLMVVDIHMPHLDGLEMTSHLPPEGRPMIIFTTAYKDYALQAFEINAVDYLLKPFSFERFMISFNRTIDHISLARLHEPSSEGEAQTQVSEGSDDHLSSQQSSEEYLTHIRVEGQGRAHHILSLDRVRLIRSAGNYAEFFTRQSQSYLRRGSLKELMTRLDPQVFLRVNRSEVVRIEEIAEVFPKIGRAHV